MGAGYLGSRWRPGERFTECGTAWPLHGEHSFFRVVKLDLAKRYTQDVDNSKAMKIAVAPVSLRGRVDGGGSFAAMACEEFLHLDLLKLLQDVGANTSFFVPNIRYLGYLDAGGPYAAGASRCRVIQ